ncbi:ATP-dependent zinc metalloprotease FtsH [Mesoaciditoga lauensis]|uniref:ATP-dependent zinc metalloprotease FtsH n=1 Tax=Mesoaciditoga lauensis TaxID=1495039 RepID=UPI0006900037|nr:ATP-dependent zinc metalloprotease FtsH [Mesoaciditoga lauensis]
MPKNYRSLGPNWKSITLYMLILILIFFLIRSMWTAPTPVVQIDFTKFWSMVNEQPTPVKEVIINGSGDTRVITATGEYELYAPWLLTSSNFVQDLIKKGINVKSVPAGNTSLWVNVLGTLIPLALFFLLWWVLMKRMGGGGGSQAFTFTKSPARIYNSSAKKVTFNDVAGVEEAKEELKSVVEFLKNPQSFNTLGARMPKGILLVGPPGTGKTLLARAVAGEADVPFYHISGSDFVELFVGVGAARVRDLFTQAKQNSPSIVFIDEIDAVGRQRGAGLGGGHDEREQTLNQLLVEMDGFDKDTAVIVMAATNRPDILDSALLRPGRFDKKILVDPPDIKGREAILRVHMRGKPIDSKVDPKVLARRTPGFVGADLENLVNEAALLAAQRRKKQIEFEDFEEAIDRVIAGPERKSKVVSEEERKIVAYHEIGHAIVGAVLPNADPVHKISIVPRGMHALGFTLQLPLQDKYLMSKEEILDKITGLLGGRAAEEIVFGQITTGASNDIERATKIARDMVCKYGMSDLIGPIAWGEEEENVFLGKQLSRMRNYSEETASEIDVQVKKIVSECYDRAKEILLKYRDKMDDIAEVLLKKETIQGEELNALLKGELGRNGKNEEGMNEESDVAKGNE